MKFMFPVDRNGNKIAFNTFANKVFYNDGTTVADKMNKAVYIGDSENDGDIIPETEINDNVHSGNFTWSSKKIQKEMDGYATSDDVNELSKRIDNLAKDMGESANDKELQDIRVGYDGTIYNNAGTAVRTQIKKTLDEIHESGVLTFVHAYDSSTKKHTFTNPMIVDLTHVSGKVKVVSGYTSGDTFAVNGVNMSVVTFGSGTPDADTLPIDRWINFIVDGDRLNFNSGGGLLLSKLASANAGQSDGLSGFTFYAGDKVLKQGSMPNNGKWVGTYPTNGSNGVVNIPNGYHNGQGSVSIGNNRSGSIANYANISGNASIPEGYYANNCYVDVPGGNRGTWTATYSGSNIDIPQGYHNGSGYVTLPGGNKKNWSYIYPGTSDTGTGNTTISIPQGYHNGSGNLSVAGGNKGAWNETITASKPSIKVSQGYHNGSGAVSVNTPNIIIVGFVFNSSTGMTDVISLTADNNVLIIYSEGGGPGDGTGGSGFLTGVALDPLCLSFPIIINASPASSQVNSALNKTAHMNFTSSQPVYMTDSSGNYLRDATAEDAAYIYETYGISFISKSFTYSLSNYNSTLTKCQLVGVTSIKRSWSYPGVSTAGRLPYQFSINNISDYATYDASNCWVGNLPNSGVISSDAVYL